MRFTAIPTDLVAAYRAGGPDANGQVPERDVASGSGNPCRHCLGQVPEGAPMLVLAHRPFATVQPYAEVGPIFLCGDDCAQGGGEDLPAMLTSAEYIVRGYGADERILYGTGGVIATGQIKMRAAELLADPAVAFVHIRSAKNNCFQCRVERA
jgi:hypothetical protein